MKKLIPIISLAFILFGCKKAAQIPTPQDAGATTKYNVKFTMANFAAATATVSTPGTKAATAVGDTLKNYADNLYYRVYNVNGVYINAIAQKSTAANFGTIIDQLPVGTYNVFLGASKGELSFSENGTIFSQASYRPAASTGWKDVFTASMSLKVTAPDVNVPVRLERQVAGLRLQVEDAIPANAAKVMIIINYDSWSLNLNNINTSTGTGQTILEYPLTAADKGVKNKTFDGYIANMVSNVSLIIRAYTSTNSLLVEKNIINLKFEKNQRMVITGNLFSEPTNPTAGFIVTADPAWTTGTFKF